MKISGDDALSNARNNRWKRYPRQNDPRTSPKLLFPRVTPKFRLSLPSKVFTIGSCFARNVEEALEGHGAELPTSTFRAPKAEWKARPNGLLNEYNPGTMFQRIRWALEGSGGPAETIVPTAAGHADLLLHAGADVSLERAVERRREIADVYGHLASSAYVIITLGLVEAWYDHETECYLNRMPPGPLLRRKPERFEMRQLDVFQSFEMLESALLLLKEANPDVKVIVTVSPVPLVTTFTRDDAVIANSYSKSVLRVCAGLLAERLPHVDYYPSYEIAMSGGLTAFEDDQVHIKPEVVRAIIRSMLEAHEAE